VTIPEFFESAVLDMNVLSIAIINRSEMFADDPDYSPSGYRKAAYTVEPWIFGKGSEESCPIMCSVGSEEALSSPRWKLPRV